MPFEFRPAKLEGVGLFIALAGGSTTGKTLTALRLARGIAGPHGKIAAIDTEGRRMSHYSNDHSFDVYNLRSPFHPFRFAEAAKGAEEAGYSCLVIDSFSLEWSGLGGVLAMYDEAFKAKGSQDKYKDICWSIAKAPHKLMINDLIQCTMPIIFCLRANPVSKHLAGNVDGRWKVEQDKKFLYEWTVSLTLHPNTPGMPRYDMEDFQGKPLWKVQEQHRHIFPEGKLIGEEAGAALQAWRNSGAARKMGSKAVEPERTDDDDEDVPDFAKGAAGPADGSPWPRPRATDTPTDKPKPRTWLEGVADLQRRADDCATSEAAADLSRDEFVKKAREHASEAVQQQVEKILGDAYDRCVKAEAVPT